MKRIQPPDDFEQSGRSTAAQEQVLHSEATNVDPLSQWGMNVRRNSARKSPACSASRPGRISLPCNSRQR